MLQCKGWERGWQPVRALAATICGSPAELRRCSLRQPGQALVAVRRAAAGGGARERSHLLALLPQLAACVGGREPRVAVALRELLGGAAAQLGLAADHE
jgi:hypothetical protein